MKSSDRIIEEQGGWIAFTATFVISFFISPVGYNYMALIQGFPAIGLGVFGFMLTFVAIILQSDNDTIAYMKSKKNLFALFVGYNKRVVSTAALLTIFTYIFPFLSFPDYLAGHTIDFKDLSLRFSMSFFWASLLKLAVDMYFFIRSFYILLKK